MMNQSKTVILTLSLTSFFLLAMGCGGGESEETRAPVVKKRTTPPPKPAPKTIEQLATNFDLDDRIVVDEKDSPRSESHRVAILKFFNAMLQADNATLKSMLSFNDQLELKSMMDTGFADQMEEVTLLMLKTGSTPDGDPCVMAIYEVDLDYQVQMWFMKGSGNNVTFSAAATPPNLVDQLSGNWITSFFALKKKQAEIAQQPDEETSYALAGELTSTDGSLGGDDGGKRGPSAPPSR